MSAARWERRWDSSAPDLALLLFLSALAILAIHGLGFVADDFFLLVGNLNLPFTQSLDGLHRPLRNVFLHFAGSLLGVERVWPQHLLAALSFLAVLAVLYQLMRRLGAGRNGARAAVLALAFCPLNHEVLFWFAAWQDLVAGACVLLAALFFVDFRESHRIQSLLFAATANVVALGFKETTVMIPFLLPLMDFYRERSLAPFKKAAFWRAYIPFACILLLYTVYFLSDSGVASLAGGTSGGFYGFHGLLGTAKSFIRQLIRLALPFITPAPLELADVRWRHVAICLTEAVLLLLLVWKARVWPALILVVGWVVLTVLPTAVFVPFFNVDRYLFLPLAGIAIFIGLLVDSLIKSRPRALALVWITLASYCCAGGLVLEQYRNVWQQAGKETAIVASLTAQSSLHLPLGGEIDLVNLALNLRPYYIPVFATGLPDALTGYGLPPSTRVLQNFARTPPAQPRLMEQLAACTESTTDDFSNRIILVMIDHRPVQVRTSCAAPVIDGDRTKHPEAWSFLEFHGGNHGSLRPPSRPPVHT